ncbi:hypothetical protein SUGI_0195630 [Cryptomeria japonica]|uniref:acyl-CoA--sterol O-acyltransferase 1 n=1 Tax=Cryptomeria japonica TaxID=3369 RepID=UPI002408B75F|nr:acyl-CoA--sterol O-acyltransferase 1 [Cryptomeria japonica]GLJ12676.1 hypothetical protein SUGI_0195630 [Cryptomeria japonica]
MAGLSSIQILSGIICGISYSYFVVSRLPKGLARLVAVAPIIAFHTVLPGQVSTIHMRGQLSFMFMWISSFKLLMLCFDVGPLATLWARSNLLHFMAVAVIPIELRRAKPKNDKKKSSRWKTWIKLILEVCVYAGIIHSFSFRNRIPHCLIIVLYGFVIYFSLDIVLVSLAAIVDVCLGAELEPQFNKPYLASSLEDFWGKRWNLIVTNILRPSVYDPILLFCWKTHNLIKEENKQVEKKPPYWARAVALFSTFIVSGLMHEAIMYYITESRSSWDMLGFFTLHGCCTAIEVGLKRSGRFTYIAAPKFISMPITLIFIYITALWLFFPAFTRYETDIKGIAEYELLIKYLFPPSE